MPSNLVNYINKSKKAKDKVMNSICKKCGKTMEQGCGISCTPGVCAKCMGEK